MSSKPTLGGNYSLIIVKYSHSKVQFGKVAHFASPWVSRGSPDVEPQSWGTRQWLLFIQKHPNYFRNATRGT